MNMIAYALVMAKRFYDKDTYDHALRVATYVAENPMIHRDNLEDCIALAIMHDLCGNTGYSWNPKNLDAHFGDCLELLTRPDGMEYQDYVKSIRDCADTNPEAYWVKLADIKDHLLEADALGDRLKEKYWKALSGIL